MIINNAPYKTSLTFLQFGGTILISLETEKKNEHNIEFPPWQPRVQFANF